MTKITNFTNPYRSFKGAALRLNLNAPVTDVHAVRSVLLEHGGLQTAWALFLQHLANHVRQHNLTLADHDQLVDYILTRCSESELYPRSVEK